MNTLKILMIAGVIGATSMISSAYANNMETVKVFYELLSNPASKTHAEAFLKSSSEAWQSQGDYSGKNKSREAFLGQMGGFGKLIPNLNWKIEAIHQDGDFVTVRSRATGTPAGKFFGVDGQGRSFDIMTIDVHEFKDGVIVKSYHVEDWAGALRQLSGK